MEKETANFWRFRHENFLRGRPELLGEIRRLNNHNTNGNTAEKKVKATTVKAEGAGGTEEDVSELKTEVSFLKEKLAKMTSNIDQLTSLVEKISMNERQGPPIIKKEEEVMVSNKRKKLVPPSLIVPDSVISSNPAVQLEDRMEDVEYSTISMLPPSRQESESSDISDDAFVDELLNSFQDDNDDELDLLPDPILSDDDLMLTDTLLEKENTTQQSNTQK